MRSNQFKDRKKQAGASPILTVMFLGMAAVILAVAFKIYPAFYEHWQIESVVDSFQREADLSETSVSDIEKRFQARLQTNSVRGFKFDENVVIEMTDDLLLIEVEYEVRVNIYRNIDATMSFSKSLEKRL